MKREKAKFIASITGLFANVVLAISFYSGAAYLYIKGWLTAPIGIIEIIRHSFYKNDPYDIRGLLNVYGDEFRGVNTIYQIDGIVSGEPVLHTNEDLCNTIYESIVLLIATIVIFVLCATFTRQKNIPTITRATIAISMINCFLSAIVITEIFIGLLHQTIYPTAIWLAVIGAFIIYLYGITEYGKQHEQTESSGGEKN